VSAEIARATRSRNVRRSAPLVWNAFQDAIHGRGRGKPPFPGRDCVFCRERSAWEENSVAALEDLVADAEFAGAIERNGLCLRHGQMGRERGR